MEEGNLKLGPAKLLWLLAMAPFAMAEDLPPDISSGRSEPSSSAVDSVVDQSYQNLLMTGLKLKPEWYGQLITDYAKFINHEKISQMEGDEFAIQRVVEESKKSLSKTYAQTPDRPTRPLLEARLGTYDFAKGQFPVVYYLSRMPFRMYRPCLKFGIRNSCLQKLPIGALPEEIYVNVDTSALPHQLSVGPGEAEKLVEDSVSVGNVKRVLSLDAEFIPAFVDVGPGRWTITYTPIVKAYGLKRISFDLGRDNVLVSPSTEIPH